MAWGEGNVQDGGEEEGKGRNGWLSHGGRALIKSLNGSLQRVIGMFRLDLEADYRADPQRPWAAMRRPADLKFQIVCCEKSSYPVVPRWMKLSESVNATRGGLKGANKHGRGGLDMKAPA